MFVNCLFYKEPPVDGYSGRAYTYETDLALTVGDKVMLPTKDGEKRGIVVMTHLDAPSFPCKKIVSYDPGKGETA